MMQDLINDAISNLRNHERIGKSECNLKPVSKLLIEVLNVFQKEGYIGDFEKVDDMRGGVINVKLIKRINDCGVIKPRYSSKSDEFPKWEKRYLPSRDFGVIVVTTPEGVMSHRDAKEKGIGGRLIAYVY